jgi:type 1 glutamine amidotransferase
LLPITGSHQVYLNHVLTGPHTVLLGLRYTDPTGKVWMQGHAGWVRQAGKGTVAYFLPGHSALDFEDPAYARIVLNAVIWKP